MSLPHQLARADGIVEARPAFFFRTEQQEGRREVGDADHRPRPAGRTTLPGAVAYRLSKPPQFADVSDEQFRADVERALAERLATIRAERARRGQTEVLGAQGAWDQDPHASPETAERLFALNPRFAGRRGRPECALDLVTFWTLYPPALRAFRDGEHDVEFPAGTYLMRVRFNAVCRELEHG